MQHCGTVDRSAVLPKAAPLFARLLSKLVLEVLPASLASVIGALLLAHYQFGHPAASAGGTAATAQAPASPEMLQLVRDEHDLIRNLIMAQQAAQAGRYVPADARSKQTTADAELASAHRAANAVAAKTPETRAKTAAAASPLAAPAPAAAMPAVAAAPQPLPAIAGLPNSAAPTPPAAHRSLVGRIVRAPLHAVMAIGGIPSWIGHRLGNDEPDSGERMFSAAS